MAGKFYFKLGIVSLSLMGFVPLTQANSEELTETKTVIYLNLDFDSSRAHEQLQFLKNMDVIGVNFKKHRAEVSVNSEELDFLEKKGLSITKANNRLTEMNTALNGYLTPDQVIQSISNLNQKYPQLTKAFEIGKTTKNRSIMALEVSAHVGDHNLPVVLFNAMHHAREVMTTEVVMHIADFLTSNYGNDKEVTNWLDHYRVIIVPQVNPDGNLLVQTGQTMWRKNAYEVRGKAVGVDLNRNYPTYWNYCNGSSSSTSSETFRGPSAGSEPETRAIMQLVSSVKPVADISYHSYSELIIYPYGCSSLSNPSKTLFKSLADEMNLGIRNDENQPNSYTVGTAPDVLYEVDGSDLDWQWKEHGVFAYTIEVNSSDFQPNYSTWRNVTVARQEGGWKAILKRLSQGGIRGKIQNSNLNDVTYSLRQVKGSQLLAFDADSPNRTFSLRSENGLLFQLLEKGVYEITFLQGTTPIKTLNVSVDNQMIDLGNISL